MASWNLNCSTVSLSNDVASGRTEKQKWLRVCAPEQPCNLWNYFIFKIVEKIFSPISFYKVTKSPYCFLFIRIKKVIQQQIWHIASVQSNPHRHPESFANVPPAVQCPGGKDQVSWRQRNLWVPDESLPYLRSIFHEGGCPRNQRGGNLLAQGPGSLLDDTASSQPSRLMVSLATGALAVSWRNSWVHPYD